MAKDFRIKKYNVKKVDGGYHVEGINRSGKKFTSKVHSSEQSARSDVEDQNNKDYLDKARSGTSAKKKKAIGGRSPRMDKIVKKHGPKMRKKGMSQYDVATMAKNVVEGGSVEDWRKRYKGKPKAKVKPKRRVIGSQTTKTFSGKASEVQKPKVESKKLYGDWLD